MTSTQIVVGRPSTFDFPAILKTASSVKLAVAFANKSGWSLLEVPLLNGSAIVKIVVGLNFGITDPALLEEWLKLSAERPGRFEVRVAPERPTFHPKVIIVRQDASRCFAIIGSGNLTRGGLSSNVECGAYVDTTGHIGELDKWYDGLRSVLLSRDIIEAYKPLYERAKKSKEDTPPSVSRKLAAALNQGKSDWYDGPFLDAFTQFISTSEGKQELNARIAGAKQIHAALDISQFNFTREGWIEFYKIPQFGKVRETYPGLAKAVPRLQRAFQFLLAKPLDEERLQSVLNGGKYHVKGLGINLVSKVLTVNARSQWPLMNDRVVTTLNHYSYPARQTVPGYLRFASDMRECLARRGAVDFWALDAFCEHRSRELDD
jgi:hypothetical protein